jgi:hypothetical protein
MIKGLKDVWSKLTPEEQKELGDELDKMFQEEIDREIIAEVKRIAAENNNEQSQ